MTDSVSEPVCEPAEELRVDEELSDEALDRTAGQGGKLTHCAFGCFNKAPAKAAPPH